MAENTTLSPASVVNPTISSLVSGAGSLLSTVVQAAFNKKEADAQRQWNEDMMDKQNAWSLDMWNKTNEYNTPESQVNRLRDAGLNPLYYGLDGSSANGLESAQPLGYDRANMSNMDNPLATGVQTFMQSQALNKELELKNAQIDKLKEETAGVGLDNEFKDRTMAARTEAENLKNELTKQQINIARQELKNKAQEFEKLIAETNNEIERKALIQAQTVVQKALAAKTDAETKSILELLPYEKLLKQAQTDAQKAAAAASYASAALNRGLLDAGYVDKLVDQIASQSEYFDAMKSNAEAQAALNKFKMALRNGTIFDTSASGMPKGKGQMFIEDVIAGFFSFTSTLSDALGGSGLAPLAGVAIGALANQGAPASAPTKVSMSAAMGK